VKKFRGFFTAFFLPNFLEIPVLGLKKSLSGSQSYQKPLQKFRGFFTAFFQLNFLKILILGLKINQYRSHPKPTDISGFFVFSVFRIIESITFTATNCDILSNFHDQITTMKIEIKLITKRKETFEGFPLVIKISHQNKRKSKTVSFCFE
jgi:hypothetical protein